MRHKKLKNTTIQIVPLVATLLLSVTLATNIFAQTDCQKCNTWQAKVDPKIKLEQKTDRKHTPELSKPQINDLLRNSVIDTTRTDAIANLDEKTIFEAIECLLKLKGRKHDSRIVGATRSDTSQTFGASRVEIAGLYYVSYLFFQNWGHAGAAVLVNHDGNSDTNETVSKAYEAYQRWFKKVKKIGLEEARRQKLDPLEGLGISWY